MSEPRRAFLARSLAAGAGLAAAGFAAGRAFGQQGANAPGGPGAPGTPAAPGAPGAPGTPAAPRGAIPQVEIGSGAHRFAVQHDWLTPPAGLLWGDTHGVVQDAQGRIYVAHTVHPESSIPHAVVVFDKDGRFLRSWGEAWRGGAHGLDLRAEGGTEYLYHCDTNRRLVTKTTLDGTVVWEVGCPIPSGVYAKPEAWCPTNVAFSPDGDLLVGDGYGSSFIHRFSADGQWRKVIATPGSGEGQVSCPHGLWVDPRPTAFTREPSLCVADRGNRRIQYLSLDGRHLGFLKEGMRMPCDMKFRDGRMLVPDLESVVTILDEKNVPLVQMGDGHPSKLRGAPRAEFIPGKFIHPHDAIWLQDGSILVAEWVPVGRITRLSPIT